jgi:hypothetical protein
MREIPSAPESFIGTLDELYDIHAKHVLIAPDRVRSFHRAISDFLNTADPIHLIRKTGSLVRGEILRNKRGHLIRASDNLPPWYVHHALYTPSTPPEIDIPDFVKTTPCHIHQNHLQQSVNSKGCHVAHLFDVNNRDTDFHSWKKEELCRRMIRSIHPCNYFYIPMQQWQHYGRAEQVLSYFYDKLSGLYHEVWNEFLILAKAAPISRIRNCEMFKYSIGKGTSVKQRRSFAKEQKQNRMIFKKAWLEQDIWVTFKHEGVIYRYPHDEFLDILSTQLGIIRGTKCWEQDGIFHFPRLSKKQKELLQRYIAE